jgi:predicted dehydrogenase
VIKIAIIGTGVMGRIHATGYKLVRGCKVTSCCDVDLKKSREFAREYNLDSYYGVVDDLLSREEIDAVSIVTPNDTHLSIARKFLERGIPVFCEKPLDQNYESAQELAELAESLQVVNMVNFVHRGSAELQKAAELVANGDIGRVMHVEASYLQSWMTSDYWGDWKESEAFLWRLSPRHAGKGVISDIGPSLLDLVSYVAGDICDLRTDVRSFNKGVRGNKLQGYNLDSADSAVISAGFENGAMGAIHMTRWATGEMNSLRLRVYGDEGGITLDIEEEGSALQICNGEDRHKARWKNVKLDKVASSWQSFIDAVAENDLKAEPSFTRGAQLQKLLETSLSN